MTQQTINIGTVPNDDTGDAIRVAYDKCNDNFDELYGWHTLGFACSDVTSDLTTGEKIVVDIPFTLEITRVYASVATAPTGSALTVDVEDEGTSIFASVLSIAASSYNAEKTGAVFSGSASSYTMTKGDLLTIDIDQIGSTVAGAGLVVTLEGIRS